MNEHRQAVAWRQASKVGPRHVAIIMDGNGRWAEQRGLPRAMGHRTGVEAVRRTVRAAMELGIEYLTLFSFSSENWSRPASEIGDLFGLLRRFIRNDLAILHRDGVRVRVIGERENLDGEIRRLLDEAEHLTRDNDKLVLIVAFNYGARQEIARAAQRMAAAVSAGDLPLTAVTAGRPSVRAKPTSACPPSGTARDSLCPYRASPSSRSLTHSSKAAGPSGVTSLLIVTYPRVNTGRPEAAPAATADGMRTGG